MSLGFILKTYLFPTDKQLAARFYSSCSSKLTFLNRVLSKLLLLSKKIHEAHSSYDIFRQWGAKKIDRSYNKSLLQTNSSLTKKISKETLSEELEPVLVDNFELKINKKKRVLSAHSRLLGLLNSNMRNTIEDCSI